MSNCQLTLLELIKNYNKKLAKNDKNTNKGCCWWVSGQPTFNITQTCLISQVK